MEDNKIILPLEGEDYNSYIARIRGNRLNIKIKEEYQERHHVIPKCLGGGDEEENLLYLYPEEHYCAHKLLALENPNNYGLVAAWHKMQHPVEANQQRKYIVTSEDFGEAKRLFGKLHSEKMKGSNNPNYGHTISQEQKNAISRAWSKHTHPVCRKVRNVETGIIFPTCTLAAQWCGLSDCSTIIKQIKGKLNHKSAGKHPETGEKLHWEYVE